MIKTCHTRLKLNKSQTDLLDSMCDLYTKAKHTGFKLIAKSNVVLFKNNINSLNTKDIITSLSSEQKKLLAARFNLTVRHVNSINIELGMIISSYTEQRNNHLSDLNYSLSKITKSISKYNKINSELEVKFNILKNSNLNKQIYAYKKFIIQNKSNKNKLTNRFIFNYKDSNLPSIIKPVNLKALLLTQEYKYIDGKLLAATQTYGKNLFQIHLLNKKLNILKNKIAKIKKDINQGKIRICFGTKALYNQQNITSNINSFKFNFQSVLFEDHIDWLISWYDSRSHQFLITGAGEETSGNQNCNVHLNDKELFNLRLRLPDNLINKSLNKDKYLTIKDVDFGKNNSLLQASLLSETKEVRILTVVEKEVIKKIKENLFELKKSRFELTKKIKLANKTIINFDSTNLNNDLLKIDDEIIKLQKEINIKSDIFTLNNKEKNNVLNEDNDIQNLSRTRKKKIGIPITYRFVKNINRNSPKYGTWSVHFTVEVKEPEIITDISLGAIGVDLNKNHLAVTEIDSKGKLIQSFNVYFNPEAYNSNKITASTENKPFKLLDSNSNKLITLPIVENQFKLNEKSNTKLSEISTDKTQNILENAIKIVTSLSLRTGKPIIIEKLDFTEKKKQLISTNKLTNKFNNKFNYNHMISSFAYAKFKELLKSQSARSGLQVIEVNPAYSSLIGAVNYVKPLGLSIHMAASYVIAQRGLKNNETNKFNKYKIDEKPRIIVVNENELNKNKLEIYTKSKVYLLDYIVNSSLTEDMLNKSNFNKENLNEWSIISNLYKTLQKDIYKENLQKEKLKTLKKLLPALSNELDLSYLFSEDNLQVHNAQ